MVTMDTKKNTPAPAADPTAPSGADEPRVSARQVLARFVAYYKPYKFLFFFDLVCASVLAAVDLAFPQFLGFFTREFFLEPPEAILSALGWIALGVRRALRRCARPASTSSRRGAISWARAWRPTCAMDLFEQYQRLSFSYYDRNNTGEMMSKLLTDLFDISELAHHGPENLFICILKIAGSFVLAVHRSTCRSRPSCWPPPWSWRPTRSGANYRKRVDLHGEPQEDGRHQRAAAGLARRHPRGEVLRQRGAWSIAKFGGSERAVSWTSKEQLVQVSWARSTR